MRFHTKGAYKNVPTFDEGYFTSRDGLHEIHYLRSGRRGARPVLVVHGGPGGGSSRRHLEFFHPQCWDIIQVDQRGSGGSLPLGGLANNDTDHLIEDFEQLREKLGIPSWTLWGGSWGTFLAVAYAEQYLERVDALVLRAMCLYGDEEMHVNFEPGGAAVTYPERFAEFSQYVPANERHDLVAAYYRRLILSDDPALHNEAAYRWSRWLCSLDVDDNGREFTLTEDDVAAIRIECLYSQTRGFRAKNRLLQEAHKLAGKPVMIVHGRRDLLCPPVNAFQIHRAIPGSRLTIVQKGAHTAYQPAMRAALLGDTNSLVK